ncbi:hypothetical protein EYC08_21110 [Tabrizicola sp. WMC-M-20]|nr:hypothetical protein EYC08_21110 [Tabrizicola sp. WMC-M-20]
MADIADSAPEIIVCPSCCSADLAEVVDDIRASGKTSLRAIAAEMSARGISTRRGGQWGVGNVRGLLERAAGIQMEQAPR